MQSHVNNIGRVRIGIAFKTSRNNEKKIKTLTDDEIPIEREFRMTNVAIC